MIKSNLHLELTVHMNRGNKIARFSNLSKKGRKWEYLLYSVTTNFPK